MTYCFKKITILLFFLCFTVVSNAQESIYSEINYQFLDKLINATKKNYPKVKANQIKLLMAKDNIAKARIGWFDVISFSVNYSPTNSISISNYVLTGYQFGVSVNVASMLLKPYNVKAAKNEYAMALLDKEDNDRTLELEVKNRYIKYVQVLATLKLQSKVSVDIEANFKQLKYKYELGEVTFEAYNQALVGLAAQKQNVISLEGSLLLAKYNLEDMICEKLEDIH